MNAQRPKELHVAELYDGDICIHVQHADGLFKFKLSPEHASKLAECLIADTGEVWTSVISEGEEK